MKRETLFLLLVIGQTFHSIEEYAFRLWETFPPAMLVTGLVSVDLEFGFIVINAGIVAFGWWCYFWPVRKRRAAAVPLAWAWAGIETVNGVGHPAWGIATRGYTPGLVSALLMLPVALMLMRRLADREKDIGR